jgi:hypothetical protein
LRLAIIRYLQRVIGTVILTEYPTPKFLVRIFDFVLSWRGQSAMSSFNLDFPFSAVKLLILMGFKR